MPTGGKLLLILSAALLPLALIGFGAVVQSSRSADQELRSHLRVAAIESARTMMIELLGDMNALRVALNALADGPVDVASCARADAVFAEQLSAGARFAILDGRGRLICGTKPPWRQDADARVSSNRIAVDIPDPSVLRLAIGSSQGNWRAIAWFPEAFLARVSEPSGFDTPYAATLYSGSHQLTLKSLDDLGAFDRMQSIRVKLGLEQLTLAMRVRGTPIASAMVIAMLLPLLMWAAAAGITWLVVNRLLVRPLRQLRGAVAAYRPGEIIDPRFTRGIPAQEIRDLGDTFHTISQLVVLHEAELAAGLDRQTQLTREVHHRVKNNLQVISSLINFHARASKSDAAADAYAAIQRRVDALAVVHRNHFAELDNSPGVSLRSVIGDLATNLRATAAGPGAGTRILLSVDSLYATQDVATAVAFLLTELIEIVMIQPPTGTIRISLIRDEDKADRAELRADSFAFIDSSALAEALADRYGRILEGLSRQLRAKLNHDGDQGSYAITIAVIPAE